MSTAFLDYFPPFHYTLTMLFLFSGASDYAISVQSGLDDVRSNFLNRFFLILISLFLLPGMQKFTSELLYFVILPYFLTLWKCLLVRSLSFFLTFSVSFFHFLSRPLFLYLSLSVSHFHSLSLNLYITLSLSLSLPLPHISVILYFLPVTWSCRSL